MDPKINLVEIPSLPFDCTAYPQGEYITGCADIMIGKREDGSFFRLFYPSRRGDIKNVPPDAWTDWSPNKKCSEGIAKAKAPPCMQSIYGFLLNKMLSNVRSPLICEAPVANGKFPVIVFSHGLNSIRSACTGLCSNLASYGLIVASIEHRDGSASATFTFTADGEERWIFLKRISKEENRFEIIRNQAEIRREECSRVLDILEKINFGENLVNEIDSNFELISLKGIFDMSTPIMMGYSFGGANAILSLEKDERFKAGIIVDPWMFPIKDVVEQLSQTIKQPMKFILMKKFQTEKNLKCVKFFENHNNEFYTIRKGNHLHLSDLVAISARSSILKKWLTKCYEPSCPPEVLLTIINTLLKKYIFTILGTHDRYLEACHPFLEKYESKISKQLLGSATTMLGWDY